MNKKIVYIGMGTILFLVISLGGNIVRTGNKTTQNRFFKCNVVLASSNSKQQPKHRQSAKKSIKSGAKEVGHSIRDGVKETGHAIKGGVKSVGHSIKRGGKTVGHSVKRGAKGVGHFFRNIFK